MGNLAQQPHPALAELDQLLQRYRQVRATSEAICAPLQIEDYVIQSTPEVSPPKWHLAHVTWFFETFVLLPYLPGYRCQNKAYDFLFNSYYQTHGVPFPRARRGMLSRPGVKEVYRYREQVDQAIGELLANPPREQAAEIVRRVGLGLQHEQQHQELLLMDIKHILAQNPLHPVYRDDLTSPLPSRPTRPRWYDYAGGVQHIGHAGSDFAFDCETPRHRQFVEDFQLAERLVTNGEYLSFIADGGYARPELWLSDGWDLIQQAGWNAPLYWLREDEAWHEMTLGGLRTLDLEAPVCHVSYYEADAYALWAGARLPSEVATFSRATTCNRSPRPPATTARCSCSAMSGNGRPAPTCPIPAFARWKAASVNTTANSCPARWCCAEAVAPRRNPTCGSPTATSSSRRCAGSSPGCAWHEDSEHGPGDSFSRSAAAAA